ncbi:hypothetical protein [Chenggangzhangella methanolivorans]|uniref:Uncharacterized protein n=1 Tax=Chenggangzhangella methanolivorans TaxID=1437009 RepID=A0A9E6UHI1_9HYPH|nr:hypothetical protein [Chenggangzhangella methanolivorans]QZN99807.1 hypothetical protein K6K41_24610 [Chenggangzhangella methanolivorans]
MPIVVRALAADLAERVPPGAYRYDLLARRGGLTALVESDERFFDFPS